MATQNEHPELPQVPQLWRYPSTQPTALENYLPQIGQIPQLPRQLPTQLIVSRRKYQKSPQLPYFRRYPSCQIHIIQMKRTHPLRRPTHCHSVPTRHRYPRAPVQRPRTSQRISHLEQCLAVAHQPIVRSRIRHRYSTPTRRRYHRHIRRHTRRPAYPVRRTHRQRIRTPNRYRPQRTSYPDLPSTPTYHELPSAIPSRDRVGHRIPVYVVGRYLADHSPDRRCRVHVERVRRRLEPRTLSRARPHRRTQRRRPQTSPPVVRRPISIRAYPKLMLLPAP